MCKIGLKSPHLLHLLDNCPANAEPLITRMLRVLTDPRKVAPPNAQTDPIMPPKEVVDRMRWLYRERTNDVRFIVPVIVGLSKQEVIELLPRIFQLNETYIKEVISRLLRGECLELPCIYFFNSFIQLPYGCMEVKYLSPLLEAFKTLDLGSGNVSRSRSYEKLTFYYPYC